MPSPGAELLTYKALGMAGVTLFSSVPVVLGMIEPATYQDIEARYLYMAISSASAAVVLRFYQPKDKSEAAAIVPCATTVGSALSAPRSTSSKSKEPGGVTANGSRVAPLPSVAAVSVVT